MSSVGDAAIAALRGDGGWLTSAEVSEITGLPVARVGAALGALYRHQKIARADVGGEIMYALSGATRRRRLPPKTAPLTTVERASLLRRPPAVTMGVLRVLEVLGPDFTPREWSARLDVPVEEIRRALAWLERDERRRAA